MFGKRAGENAAEFVRDAAKRDDTRLAVAQAQDAERRVNELVGREERRESTAQIRRTMADALEEGCGIYRDQATIQQTCDVLAELKQRSGGLALKDKSKVFNTDLLSVLELLNMLEIAETVAHSALHRTESRGSHQRLDFTERDDETFLKHSMAHYRGTQSPHIDYRDVVITKSQPGKRVYGGAAEAKAPATAAE